MIDFTVCLTGFALGLFIVGVSCLLNNLISAMYRLMLG